jgi:hypothetical protein
LSMRRGFCVALLFTTAPAGIDAESAAIFQDTRVTMCRAIVREMYIEIHKHSLRKNGEDDIYETVPAICLAIVQNYTLAEPALPTASWSLVKRETRLDDEVDPDPSSLQHLMLLKQACEKFADEFQQELSELMYRAALEPKIDMVEDQFCSSDAVAKSPPTPPPRKRKKAAAGPKGARARTSSGGDKGRSSNDAPHADAQMPDMNALLKKYDTDGSISNLLEMERENPEAMLDPDDLETVQKGSVDLRCDVCTAAAKAAVGRAKKAKALADEQKLGEIVSLICYDTPPDSLEEYPKYPGNPVSPHHSHLPRLALPHVYRALSLPDDLHRTRALAAVMG